MKKPNPELMPEMKTPAETRGAVVKQRPDKGLSWWAFIRFTAAHTQACRALRKLNRLSKLTGIIGCEIKSGIAEQSLQDEFDDDVNIWSRRKALGMYERRGLPVPSECLEAELRHAEWVDEGGAK